MIPSFAVRQNWQLTAQPIWLETQIVARDQSLALRDSCAVEKSPSSPPSPSGIQTVSTVWPSPPAIKYRSVPSTDRNVSRITGKPTRNPAAATLSRSSLGQVVTSSRAATFCL